MKTKLLKVLGLVISAGIACHAQAQIFEEEAGDRGYVEVDVGGVIAPDFKLTSFGGVGLDGVSTSLEPGSRVDILVGWRFVKDFSVELNTGTVWNRVDEVGGLSISPDRFDLWQTPLLVNLVYTIPMEGPFSAYVGGGAGGVFTSVDYRIAHFDHIRDTDAAFGYQAIAGVKYAINDWADVGLAYKFMGTSSHSWEDEGFEITANPIMSHAILASFTFRF